MYYTKVNLIKDQKKLDFTPGAISVHKMKQMVTQGKLGSLPDPLSSLIWINYRKVKPKVQKNIPKVKKYRRVNMKKLTSYVPPTKQNESLNFFFEAMRNLNNSVKNKSDKKSEATE